MQKVILLYLAVWDSSDAHKRVVTPTSVVSKFKKGEIFPFYSYVFEQCDFMAAAVTDRSLTEVTTRKYNLSMWNLSPFFEMKYDADFLDFYFAANHY